ncbi:MAG: ATP-grasp domain-containing protein [Lachnospiraceae bacterium]
MYNVLISSAGRRVELVKLFIEAAKELQIESKVVAIDCSTLAPALYFADDYAIVPRLSEETYLEEFIKVCREKKIALIVPTIDTELLLLSENRERIEKETGAKILLSSKEVIEICRDKIRTSTYLNEQGFLVPHTYTYEEVLNQKIELPLFIKPIDGSSSINAYKVDTLEELEYYNKIIDKPMIQSYLSGEEYSVDAFLDFHSNIITMVPRLRIAMRSGEIAKGRICKHPAIMADVKRLLEVLKPIGHITIQCKVEGDKVSYIEINPRFGGGAPMSMMAGANSCKNLYRLLSGETLQYNENYQDGMTFVRFDSTISV